MYQKHSFRGQFGSISQNVKHTGPLTGDSTSRNSSYGYAPTWGKKLFTAAIFNSKTS